MCAILRLSKYITDAMVTMLWICFVLLFVPSWCDVCHDLDPLGCASLIGANSSLCQEEVFAHTACQRTCGLCPLTCYHCIDPVTDVQSCTATKQCQMGEKCMMSEVSSSKDGHHEYRLNCASNMMCDGSMIFSIVGRRDISSHCCSVDLCNRPDATASTTTSVPTMSCLRDIYILVEAFLHDDKTTNMLLSQFLSALASSLPADSQSSLAVFDRGIYFLVHFANSTQLLNYNTSTFISPHHTILDYDRTMHDLRNVLQHQDNGARANASDSVLLITNERLDDRSHGHLHSHGSYLDGLASSVTVIDVGSRNPALASLLATDANHEITVPTYQGLMSVVPQVVSLLCS